MIYYGCPKCQTPMASPDSSAGQTNACPECKNVTIIPGMQGAVSPAQSSSLQPSSVSTVATRNSEKETVLWRGVPSHWYYFGWYVFAGILAFVSLFCPSPVLLILFGLAGFIVLGAIVDRYSRKYKITSKRVYEHVGIVSRSTRELSIDMVSEIRLTQGVLERFTEIGSIGFSTASTSDIEVKFRGVPNPDQPKELVQSLQDKSRGR